MTGKGIFARIWEKYREATEPQTVERAPRRERWKRQVWMVGSLILSGVVVTASVVVSQWLGHPGYAGPLVIGILLLDFRLFAWGMEYFDLTPPWQFREAEATEEDANTANIAEYDGPKLGEMIKFSVLVGPEGGIGAWPADDGAIYVTPYTAYQYRSGEWVDLDADTEELFRGIATYVNPQEIRERQRTR